MQKFSTLNSILLVDDDDASNFLHSIFINKLDVVVDVNAALNGQEALDFILDKGQDQLALPCMVMLDLKMPVVDGWKFLEMYEEQVPERLKEQLKIVLVTISDSPEDMERAMKCRHIADFAQKPLTDATFKKLLTKHVGLALSA